MQIAFIGAGMVGKAFGLYLTNKGITVVGYYSKAYQSAVQAAELVGTKPYSSLVELVKAAEIIIITTPDDVIAELVEQIIAEAAVDSQLAQTIADKSFAHMSGVHSSELLQPLAAMGATTLSLHPLLSFTQAEQSAQALDEAYFALDGSGPNYRRIVDQLRQLNDQIIEIAPQQKALYHAALTVISNYQIAIIDLGLTMLTETDFTREQALELTEPLVRQTVNNFFTIDSEQALTGPIVRGDSGTVVKHLEAIAATNPAWLDIYRLLGEQTIELAQRAKRINNEQANNLKEVLDSND